MTTEEKVNLIFDSLELENGWRAWNAGDRVVVSLSHEHAAVWEIGPDLEVSHSLAYRPDYFLSTRDGDKKRLFEKCGLKPKINSL